MRQKKNPEVYAFIDSQNLNLGVQKMGWKMDWRKFRAYLYDTYGVTKAFMFIGYIAENEKMYEQIHEAGYLIVLKPTTDMTKPVELKVEKDKVTGSKDAEGDDPTKKLPIKGNIDAELVLWAMKELKHYEKAIIVSGDGDFYCLAEYLVEQGKLLNILTPNWQYSGLLKQFEKYIVRLDQHRRELSYRTMRRKPVQK